MIIKEKINASELEDDTYAYDPGEWFPVGAVSKKPVNNIRKSLNRCIDELHFLGIISDNEHRVIHTLRTNMHKEEMLKGILKNYKGDE